MRLSSWCVCVWGAAHLSVLRRRRGHPHRSALLAVPICVAALAGVDTLCAQEGGDESRSKEESRFHLYRWQEDYLWLSRKAAPLTDYERLKYIHLGGAPENYLSLGGELRYRLDRYNPYLFGLTANGRTWSSSQERAFFHADLHLTPYFRAFVQFDAAKEDGRPVRRDFDQSAPDLRQAFSDLILPTGTGTTTLRAGRQELWLGPSRWLSVRDTGNIHRSFDGGMVEYQDDNITVRGFAARPVNIAPDLFDDSTSSAEFFRGFYAIGKNPFSLPATVDLYLLGKELDSATFARGTAGEDRWTAGARVTGKLAALDYIAEGAHQFGTFGSANISAWGFYGNVSHTFAGFTATPRFGLRSHYATGDRDLASSTLRTFSAPYPAIGEVSGLSLLSVSNMMNLEPYLQLTLPHDLVVGSGWNADWKVTIPDAVYGPTGTPIKAPGSRAKDVAQGPHLYFTWDANRFLQVHGYYSRTFAGDYIKDAKGRDFDYYRLRVTMRF
jgi:alginate export protein